MLEALRYTKLQTPSHTPAIKISGSEGQPDSIASSAKEKEKVFKSQAFPRQTDVSDDIAIPDTAVYVNAKAVQEALFTQPVKETS